MTDQDFSELGMTWTRGLDGLWSAVLVRGTETYQGAPRADLDEARALCLHAYANAERRRHKRPECVPFPNAGQSLTSARDHLLAYQTEQRQALASLAAALSAAGFRGDDVVAGVQWLAAECARLAADAKALVAGLTDGQVMVVLLDRIHRYRREATEFRETLEAVNELGRSWGYGQGELDADLAGCLRAKFDALDAERVRGETLARTANRCVQQLQEELKLWRIAAGD